MQFGKLPNLNALKVLVVVANAGSFSKAADQLGLTQSAISKKIAALEAQLGQTLFTRHHKRIEITAFGRHLADISADAFDRILAELDRPTTQPAEQIRLYSDADFAELWLFPRLHRFEASLPDTRVSIFVEVGMKSPPAEDHDCAIIWGRGDWSGCNFRPLISNSVFPVASPHYFSGLDRAPRLSDIPERHLIHDQTRFWWRAFREAVGDRSINFEAGRMYNRTSLCLEAAARGDGVTIGDEISSRGYIESGRLVCPFSFKLPSPDSYFLAFPSGSRSPAVASFEDWILQETHEHRVFFEGLWRQA